MVEKLSVLYAGIEIEALDTFDFMVESHGGAIRCYFLGKGVDEELVEKICVVAFSRWVGYGHDLALKQIKNRTY